MLDTNTLERFIDGFLKTRFLGFGRRVLQDWPRDIIARQHLMRARIHDIDEQCPRLKIVPLVAVGVCFVGFVYQGQRAGSGE